MLDDKTLPNESSDYSLPGRVDDSNSIFFEEAAVAPKSKSRILVVAAVAFVLVSVGFFSYYFMNQTDIDSQILDNTLPMTIEQKLASQYGVGEFGSAHAHAAFVVFIDDVPINFGMPQFQLQSKYIHFENHNPYLIHKHATNVPLDMLFRSFGLNITLECIGSSDTSNEKFCIDSENSITFVINGERYSDITKYEIEHNDRILISFGDAGLVSEQILYLDSLKIPDVPKQNKLVPGKDISI